MGAALRLYNGKVMHARIKPVLHRFSYKMSSILIDIDHLEEADQQAAVFSVNKTNFMSFRTRDFGPRDGSDLRAYVDKLTDQVGINRSKQIQLLCYPRVLGYGFNPISVYFCRDKTKAIHCMIYEVRNTFGEMHTYVQPVINGQASPSGIRQEAEKEFYVSPFLDMNMRYFFRVSDLESKITFRILEKDEEGPILAATFCGHETAADTTNLLKAVLQTMGLTWKVTGGIHYEALKLWIKGLKIRPRIAHKLSHSFPEVKNSQTDNAERVGLQGGKYNEQ